MVELQDVAELRPAADAVVAQFTTDIADALGGLDVHHIGATSLPSGTTKGDIDVNVRVDGTDFARIVDVLTARLEVAQAENWTSTFASFSAPGYALPLGVQVTVIGSDSDYLLSLRDAMRTDPDLRRRYDDVKREAAAGGAAAYWEAKDRFLRELLARD